MIIIYDNFKFLLLFLGVKIESTQSQQTQQPNAFLSQQQANQAQSQQEIKSENMDISVKVFF